MAHDVLLSAGFGAVMAIAAAPYEEARALDWSWYGQMGAVASGFGFIFETAQLDRAFQFENDKLNTRETIVGTIVFLVWFLLTTGPVVLGAIAAVAKVEWAREHWPLIVSLVIVLLSVSITSAYRIRMYAAVRTEEWLVARRAR
jgi:hypothetical protein